MLHWFTQYIRHCFHFNENTVSKWAVYWPYRYERGGGVNIVLFISGSHLWTRVYVAVPAYERLELSHVPPALKAS